MELYNSDTERADIYKLFSALFLKEPDGEIVEQVREMFELAFKDSVEEIRNDFTSVFMRPDLHMAPYESLYNPPPGGGTGSAGKATKDVQAFYESSGLVLDEGAAVIPDHLSVELLFMSYLAENRYVGQQQAFFEGHLLRWVPEYCDEVIKHAATTFYRNIANLLKEFILSDYEMITE